MAYWWANQNENYALAIAAGTLWTRPDREGVWSAGRVPIFRLAPGDVVIHHAHKLIRAVSRVVASAISHGRPPENPLQWGESTEYDVQGQLVRLEVLHDVLHIPQSEYVGLIPHGHGDIGPLATDGYAKRRFLHELDPALAIRLLATRNSVVLDREPFAYGSIEGIRGTDVEAIGKLRVEQGHLRAYLLRGADHGICDLCGRDLPADLLVAAHIQRRSELTDAERLEFEAVAMLACVLGCDALFEAGYVVVASGGQVVAGRSSASPALAAQVALLTGRSCTRHNALTARRFAARYGQTFPES